MNVKNAPAPVAPDESMKHVWEILEATTDCVLLINKNWEFAFLNSRAIEMVSDGRDLIGLCVWDAFPDIVGTIFEANYRKAVRDKAPVTFEAFYAPLETLFQVHACPTKNGLAVFFRDITEQRARDAQLKKIEERYRLATLSTTEGIWDWDHLTDQVYYAARWNEIVGLPAVECTGSIMHWRERFHPKDLARMHADFADLETNGSAEFQHEYRICHEDGSWHWILSRGTVVRTVSGKIIRMTGSISDITAKKSVDPLTGLQNRLSLLESLEHRIAKPLVNHKTFAVLLICLDRFKQVKESFGHSTADAALIEISKRLQATLEGDDLSVVARISGHEFVVLLERIAAVNDVVTYANLLQVLLEQPINCIGQHICLTTSIGIAMGDEGYTLPEKMLEDAAIAMHQAERVRSPKCVIFGTQMREHTRRRVQIEMDIQNAARNRQLLLHYQPKVELATGRIVGFEALLRWLHPTLGMIPPGDFIPHAEESGVILEIGHWTMREAIRQLKTWRTARIITSDITMAVNLSTKQLEDSFLTQEIQSTLACENLSPSCLTLEVTESALIGNLDHAREILMSLRQLGVGLDIDDFGTGYSSLSYLHRLPFHSIKIDRSFINDLEASQESRLVVHSIIQLGQSMNMQVIAEGIETPAQHDRLIQLGCLFGQGYLYTRPLDTKTMEVFLAASKLKVAV